MPRDGELTYYEAIGEAGRRHALDKPFSNLDRGAQFMQIGAILQLLPPPPARVLECGCGTGWLSWLLQKCGYRVVGVDVSPLAIDLSRTNELYHLAEGPTFLVADAERLPFEAEFDVVLFFDSLHHSVDEQAAVAAAYRALKPGGTMVASETGPEHEEGAREISERFDVTEKSMPPRKILRLGEAAGFRQRTVYPRADDLGKCLFAGHAPRRWWTALLPGAVLAVLKSLALMTVQKDSYGIVVMRK
jgi:SAM-dependent methyltransferase